MTKSGKLPSARLYQVFNDTQEPTSPKQDRSSSDASANSSPRITLRLTPEENTRLRDMAAGMTLSSYVREALFGNDAKLPKTRRRHAPVADQQELAKALAMLGETRIANNLNQLAHKANIGELSVDDRMASQINDTYAHIQAMRGALIKALGLIEAS